MADFVGAIDQGTTSSRFMIFDHNGMEVGRHQVEHEQILPQAGWVEHNPVEIWDRTRTVIQTAINDHGLGPSDLAAIGITNQRETTVVWNRHTGLPYGNAIVWQDTRTARIATALSAMAVATSSARKLDYHRRRTSRAERSNGSSKTCPMYDALPNAGTCCSAPRIRGCCGT